MRCSAHIALVQVTLAFWLGSSFPLEAQAEVVPYLDQSFFFDWAPSTEPVPIPIVAQCDSIDISWSTTAAATGPNPVAPYYLQVYTSTFVVPLVVDAGSGTSFSWPVPFIPGTQFQICMFASNGATGGCQRMYTVIPAVNATLDNPPVCTNLSYPLETQNLGINGVVSNGALSQSGWVNQCTDISIRPTNGTPPYTLTVAPTLHPPANITSNNMDAINWTVNLSWGSPFFLSLVDSAGNLWSNGPMHSGGPASSACLSVNATSGSTNASNATNEHSGVKPGVAVGSGIGGLVLGALLGILLTFLFTRRRRVAERIMRHQKTGSDMDDGMPSVPRNGDDYHAVPSTEPSSQGSRSFAATLIGGRTIGSLGQTGQYHVEPFILPNESPEPPTPATAAAPTSQSRVSMASEPPTASEGQTSQTQSRGGRNVYVVHHDGGRPPVTVYADDGAEVVELPPRYIDDRSDTRSSDVRSEGSSNNILEQRRAPAQTPRKQNARRQGDPSSGSR